MLIKTTNKDKMYQQIGSDEISINAENAYILEKEVQMKERNFLKEVKQLANKYNLDFFIVTEGASMTSINHNTEAVRVARKNHVDWELKNNFDPNHSWD